MIVRLIVVDPRPKAGENDLRVYQVPEGSREEALLMELCEGAGLEYAKVDAPRAVRKGATKK